MRDDEPALWALEQDYTGPGRPPPHPPRLLRAREGRGLRPRPHPPARAHAPRPEGGPAAAHARHAREPLPHLLALRRPGRGRLGRARPAPREASRGPRSPTRTAPRTGSGASPTRRRRGGAHDALADTELLIADGHHRYETARVHHEEGGAGHVLMCLVALQDPGLTVFPTHRCSPGSTASAASPCAPRSSATSRSRRSPPTSSSRRRRDRCGWAISTPTTGGL